MQKETKEAGSETQAKIDALQAELDGKNSYFDSFKNEMTKTAKSKAAFDREQKEFAYDKMYAHYDHKIAGSTLYEHRKVAKPEKKYTDAKAEQTSIVTSA